MLKSFSQLVGAVLVCSMVMFTLLGCPAIGVRLSSVNEIRLDPSNNTSPSLKLKEAGIKLKVAAYYNFYWESTLYLQFTNQANDSLLYDPKLPKLFTGDGQSIDITLIEIYDFADKSHSNLMESLGPMVRVTKDQVIGVLFQVSFPDPGFTSIGSLKNSGLLPLKVNLGSILVFPGSTTVDIESIYLAKPQRMGAT